MPVRVVSLSHIPRQQSPGRELQWLATPEPIGAEKISMAVLNESLKSSRSTIPKSYQECLVRLILIGV
jgi:hypothetical protein